MGRRSSQIFTPVKFVFYISPIYLTGQADKLFHVRLAAEKVMQQSLRVKLALFFLIG